MPKRRVARRKPARQAPSSSLTTTRQGRSAGKFVLVLVNIAVFALLLLGLELGARAFFPRNLEGLFNDPRIFLRKRPFVEPHPRRGLALRPGYAGERYHVNREGFRGPELPRDLSQRALVLVLGESSTFGWLVEEEGTYPVQLQEILDRAALPTRPFVLNAGVPSYTSAQVDLYLQELLQRFQPALVVVNVFWNDALFACLDNWMPEYLVIQQPKPWRHFLLRHSAVYRAVTLREPRVGHVAGKVENPEALRFYEEKLTSMQRRCKERRIPLFFVQPCVDPLSISEEGMKIWRQTIPAASFEILLLDFEKVLEHVAHSQDISIIPCRLAGGGPENSQYFLDPVHLNAAGNRILAQDIAKVLLRQPILTGTTQPVTASGE